MREVKWIKLGVTPYLEAKDIQLKAREKVKQGFADGILITLQHPPVFTVGSSGGFDNILIPMDQLKKKAEIYEVERGGNITFHGPGQIVAYPVFNLEKWQKDVHLYVNMLEEVVIKLLSDYGIAAGRKQKYTGVWVGDEKICALGVAIRHWITWHGIAFNVNTDLNFFHLINPCGITEFGVTSLEKLGIVENIQSVTDKMVEKFREVFDMDIEEMTLQDLK
ncbi:lipoyl(octanoyl) transferase [Biomaibacter acetigenes]|uniref:Octanoyltransferase n=1 Tax=Biomaibacter acetigenes TaxID=2316383 RepID=A0A3G2R636_9FIRM|nr:lipoyl(octanoyl) transferase LipB [Biomaibacter acetigenes]AYO30930.1 lipoyl(octanoyl) transferase [Biomaibacter acetigenes]RKL61953.1 lipoyl(octanoyl) transferase [Thermoanaerobacteraceae bacterium SP2]